MVDRVPVGGGNESRTSANTTATLGAGASSTLSNLDHHEGSIERAVTPQACAMHEPKGNTRLVKEELMPKISIKLKAFLWAVSCCMREPEENEYHVMQIPGEEGFPDNQLTIEDRLQPRSQKTSAEIKACFKEIAEQAVKQAKLWSVERALVSRGHLAGANASGASAEIQALYSATTQRKDIPNKNGQSQVVIFEVTAPAGCETQEVVYKEPHYKQQSGEIELVSGRLAGFFPDGPIVVAKPVVGGVLTEYRTFQVGFHASKSLKLSSPASQASMLCSLIFQGWDNHIDNIGVSVTGDLIIFDTDLFMLESNDFVQCSNEYGENNYNSPLGQNHLQTLNPEITDEAVEKHIQGLEQAINSELHSVEIGLTTAQARIAQDIIFKNFGKFDEYSIHSDATQKHGVYATSESMNVVEVKALFVEAMINNPELMVKVVQALHDNKIPERVICRFQENPKILHPKNTSLRQMQAFRERSDRLAGFMELRKKLLLPDTEFPPAQKTALLKARIMALPFDIDTKSKVLDSLVHAHQAEVNQTLEFIRCSVSQPLKFNTLARAIYPTLSVLHQRYRNSSQIDFDLSWENADLYSGVLAREVHKKDNLVTRLKSGERV